MDKLLKSKLVHILVTFCSATDNFEEYLSCLIDKISVESCSSNKEYIKTFCKVSDYICSTCDLAKWSQTSEGSSDARQQREVCKLCKSLYDRITDKHALKSPNWANAEWQLILIEPLQHMKCYIKEYGHREVRKVRQLGLSALIQICSNHCDLKTLFGSVLPFLEKIAEKRDQVFQSETLHIGEDDLDTHLRKIEDVLKIVCGGTDMDIRSHTMSAKTFNAGQQFTVEDELKTKLKIIQTLDRRIHSLKCWQTISGNSQDDAELRKLLFIKNLHCQKLQERNQQLESKTHGKIQRYEKHKQVLKNYTDEINKISTDNSSQYCASGVVGDLIVQSPHDKYNQTLLEETHDNVIEALENTHTNKNGIETAIGLMIDICKKLDACSAGLFLEPGTSKEEGLRTVAQTDSKDPTMETETPDEASTTTEARLIQFPSGLNTQEPLIGQNRSLKRPYQCLEIECPMVTVTPNLQAIRTEQSLTESPNSVNTTETVPEHISLLERPLQYLEEGGNTICRINHECMAFYLRCPNLLNVIHLCEDVLNGKVDALFLPLQDYLRTQPDCNNVSVVVDISGNDFTKCIMPCLIKINRQLDLRIKQLEYPYKQRNTASTAAGNMDMKTAISMLKDLIDHHPSVNCETPSELRLTVDTIGVEDSHTLTRHLVYAANKLQRHKKNAKYRETLQPTDRHEKKSMETAISILKELKGQIPFIDETSELRLKVQVIGVKDGHSLTRQIFDAAIELQSSKETMTSNSQELRQYLHHVFQYLKKGGNAPIIRETDCSAFYICCPTLANAMTLCEDFLTGKVEVLFQPLQGYLKTLPECQNVSIVVDISENDFVNCIIPSLTAIKRHLDSCVPAEGPDSTGSVAVSKYADKCIESGTANKQDSSFEGPFSVHPWDRLISQLCEEFSVEDSDFENFLRGSKTRIGDDNYYRIQSLDGRSGQKYHAFFNCLKMKFGQHDSVEFLIHLTATLTFHSDSACVTYRTAFEQYKQDIEELHLTTSGLVMEPSSKILDIFQKRPEENVSSSERHPIDIHCTQPEICTIRFWSYIPRPLLFGTTTSIVRQWNIVAVNQRDKTEVEELLSSLINNIRREMGMENIICSFISVDYQKQKLMSLLKDLGKKKGGYLVLLDNMDGHFKHEHSPCEQFLTDVMDTIAELENIKILMTISNTVSKSNAIDSFGGKLMFGGHMLEPNLTKEILTKDTLNEEIPTKDILMPKISWLGDQAPDELKDEVHIKENEVERKKKKHRRSASFWHADKKQPLELSSIRQKIKSNKGLETKQRVSPVPANHNALVQTAPAVLMRSVSIPIPGVNFQRSTHRSCPSNSLEGDNVEVEYLVDRLETTMHIEGETERMITIPDGHRAPIPAGTGSIDTQTPSFSSRGSEKLLKEWFSSRNSGRSSGGRSSCSPVLNSPFPRQSYSPTIPIMAGVVSIDSSLRLSSSYDSSGSTPRDAKSDKDLGNLECLSPKGYNKKATSHKAKFARGPPDGCEEVQSNKEDITSQPSIKEPLLFCPIVKTKFEVKPSQKSAFCPLKKLYTLPNFTPTNTSASSEGH